MKNKPLNYIFNIILIALAMLISNETFAGTTPALYKGAYGSDIFKGFKFLSCPSAYPKSSADYGGNYSSSLYGCYFSTSIGFSMTPYCDTGELSFPSDDKSTAVCITKCPTGMIENPDTLICEKDCKDNHEPPGTRVTLSSNSVSPNMGSNTGCLNGCRYNLANVDCNVSSVGPGTNGQCTAQISYSGQCRKGDSNIGDSSSSSSSNSSSSSSKSGSSSSSSSNSSSSSSSSSSKPPCDNSGGVAGGVATNPCSNSSSSSSANSSTPDNPNNGSNSSGSNSSGSNSSGSNSSGSNSSGSNSSGSKSSGSSSSSSSDSGKPGTGTGTIPELYKRSDFKLSDAFNTFKNNMETTRVVTGVKDFFKVEFSGSCPSWTIPSVSIMGGTLPSIPLDMFCDSTAYVLYDIMKAVLLVLAAWTAFRIAVL